MRTDTERLDALERLGNGLGVIHNDAEHWAVSCDGMQNLPSEDFDSPWDTQTSFLVEKGKWKPTIREAIDAFLDEEDAGKAGESR